MKELARLLKIEVHAAVGILEMLWHFTGEFAPCGDIGRIKDPAIADGVSWRKDPDTLIRALVGSGWLDRNEKYRLIVHDWDQHADESVKKKLNRMHVWFLPEYAACRDAVETEERRNPPASTDMSSTKVDTCLPSREEGQGKARKGKALLNDFDEFRKACVECDLPFSEKDMDLAESKWAFLDFEAKLAAVKGLTDRKQCGEFDEQSFRPLPQNYLGKRAWERPLRVKQTKQSKIDKYWEDMSV
jgi:hypothetical protein